MPQIIRHPTPRQIFLACFLLCAGLVAVALYFQHAVGLAPCPLCIFQRIAFIAVGVISLIAFIHNPRAHGRRIYAAAISGIAILGAAVASRHVWLQNLPAERVPECGPDLGFMLDAFPLQKVIELVLRGSGECAEVQWSLFGLTMPGWSLLWLAVLAGINFYLAFLFGGISPKSSNAPQSP